MPPRLITSVIYVSTASAGLSRDDFLVVLKVSQRNNRRFGLTGLLVFNGTNFMQCLEGDRAAVNDRLHHIGLDERHGGLSIVSHRETPHQQFPRQPMIGRYLPAGQALGQADLLEILSDDAVSDATRTLFQSFRSLGGSSRGL